MPWELRDMVEVYFLLLFSWCVLILRGSKGTGSTCSPVALCLICFFFVLFNMSSNSPLDKLWKTGFFHNICWQMSECPKPKPNSFDCTARVSTLFFRLLPGKNPSLGLALPVLDNPCFANQLDSAPDWKQGWHRTWPCVLPFNIGAVCFLGVYR